MDAAAYAGSIAPVDAGDIVVRKVFRRLIWFLFILFVVSFLDRINIGFAGLSMTKDLGLTSAMFGLSVSVFYLGYLLCEIPSNLVLARFGARTWIARIMVTWGVMSAATIFAIGPYSLYGIRLFVGMAEAGFLPGVLLYMSYWFPRSHRARASSLFMMATPITLAFGSALSGLILQMDNFLGLAGWRWLFLLEGLPAVLLGVAAYLYLDDRPAEAKWLSETEKSSLQTRLERERAAEQAGAAKRSIMRELLSRNVVFLSLAYAALVVSLNANTIWTPQIVRDFAGHSSFSTIGVIAAIPAVIAACIMPIWGLSSDRRDERLWHVTLPLLLCAGGWLLIVASSMAQPQLLGLIAVTTGNYCAMAMFWTIPASAAILSPQARPAGIALINSVGQVGAAVSSPVVGILKDITGSFTAGLLFVAAMLILSAFFTASVARRAKG